MYTRFAYLGVILIWATTPLAIQWSSEGVGYLFAVTLRMTLGVIASVLLLRMLGQELPRHRQALQAYLVCGLSIYLSMNCVYWAAQYIPSGWVSVVFGLSPIMTGVLAMYMLDEQSLSSQKILGMVMGVVGLVLVFGHGYRSGHQFVLGIVAVLMGTLIHSFSAVLIKRMQIRLSGIAVTTGGLAVAAPLFILSWLLTEGELPLTISVRALAATLYLGVIASAVGFALYYYILHRMDVSRVALITLITPVCALMLGNLFNHEAISAEVATGTGFIVAGLLVYEYGRKLVLNVTVKFLKSVD